MKKHKTGFLVLMLLFASALTLQSCKDKEHFVDTPPPVPEEPTSITLPSEVTLSSDGSSSEIILTLSKDDVWDAVLSDATANWCAVTPASGKGSGKIVVTADANDDRVPRSVDIVVSVGESKASITVSQKDTLGVKSEDNIIIDNEGGVLTIPVEANTLWEVRKADTRADWVQFTPGHGTGKGEIELTVSPNKLLAERTTEIIFTAGNATRVIAIMQQNIPEATYQTDSLALVALYNATDGKGWSNPWNLKQPVSTWKGVSVAVIDDKTRVTELRLPSRQLDGTIPLDLGNLTCLKVLDLSFNSIKGDLPEEIGNLTLLEKLNLASNKFIGAISLSITKQTELTELSLNRNRFNTFPVEICQLNKLTIIHLEDNELTSIPGEISELSNLEYLYLDNNQLSSLPSGMDKMPKLIYLHAANNQITGNLNSDIGNMKNLVSLRLEHNKLSGTIPVGYANLVNLKYIYLNDNQIEGVFPDMSKMKQLEVISLQNNKLTGDIPEFGKEGLLSTVTQIFLSNNQLTGKLTEDLRNLTNLKDIYIGNNKLDGELPKETLCAMTNNYPGYPNWETLLYLPKLTSLSLENNYFTGTIPSGLVKRLERYNPEFNKKAFVLSGNNFSGPVPKEFNGAYGSLPNEFNFIENVYPQRGGVVLTLESN